MPYMVRTFDMAGYYETRLLLTLAALAFALFMLRRGDRRFLIAYVLGVVLQGLLEWLLSAFGLRGPFQMRFFGLPLGGLAASSLQGFVEGGPLAMMGFWFGALFNDWRRSAAARASVAGWSGYAVGLGLVLAMALTTVLIASPAAVTSARPMIAPTGGWVDWLFPGLAAASFLLVAATRGAQGVRYLAYCVIGVFIYAVAVFEPLHLAGLRYVGYQEGAGFVAAPLTRQVSWMLYSLFVEVALFKVYYFAVPIALGLFAVRHAAGTTPGR